MTKWEIFQQGTRNFGNGLSKFEFFTRFIEPFNAFKKTFPVAIAWKCIKWNWATAQMKQVNALAWGIWGFSPLSVSPYPPFPPLPLPPPTHSVSSSSHFLYNSRTQTWVRCFNNSETFKFMNIHLRKYMRVFFLRLDYLNETFLLRMTSKVTECSFIDWLFFSKPYETNIEKKSIDGVQ